MIYINVKITREENASYFNVPINSIAQVPIEEYVAAVVGSEIGNSHIEACKAQAVAARTYALAAGAIISDDSSVAQAYRASRASYPNAAEAAKQTAGEVLYYNDKLISAVYSASNGGQTVSSEEHWGNKRAYLIAQDDPWDTGTKRGHGVGMSQTGAKNAAAQGVGYKDILSFYYPGTTLKHAYYNINVHPLKTQISNIIKKLGEVK